MIMLVNGLVVAQKDTGYQGDPDSLVYPGSDDERLNPSPAKRVGRGSQLSVNRSTLIKLTTDPSAGESPTLCGLITRRVSAHVLEARNTPTFSPWLIAQLFCTMPWRALRSVQVAFESLKTDRVAEER